jgi:hypothetical protein
VLLPPAVTSSSDTSDGRPKRSRNGVERASIAHQTTGASGTATSLPRADASGVTTTSFAAARLCSSTFSDVDDTTS